MNKTFYITTPIYYPSGNLHIGNVYTTLLCDAIARYKKERGYDVYFLTGTDEHGQKIQEKAKSEGKTPIEYLDGIVSEIKDLWKELQICNDDFIRTTESRHEKIVEKVFSRFLEQGDIYLGQYEGWYCTPCESFFTESQLVDGKCPDCGREVKKAHEEAYFFKMSKYSNRLLDFYKQHPDMVNPQSRLKEVVSSFIEPGLEDLCVSRTSFDWGVKVKENPKHVVYVWLDALLNYVTALGYGSDNPELYEKYWVKGDQIVHVLGKDITRFHLIYWPVFLMALGLKLPDKFLVHGWVVMKDGKMSKSKGNVVYPLPLKELYGLDLLKYYMLREMPATEDGLFTPEQFVDRCNADLANNFGNLTHRTLSMIKKYFAGNVPAYNGRVTEFDGALEDATKAYTQMFYDKMDNLDVSNALEYVFELANAANKYIDDTKPWALAKEEGGKEKLESVMSHLVNVIYRLSVLLSPVLLDGSKKVLDMLNVKEELRNYKALELPFGSYGNVKLSETIAPVYQRLDANVEIERMKERIYRK